TKLAQILAGDGSPLHQYVVFRQVMTAGRRALVRGRDGVRSDDMLPPDVHSDLAAAALPLDTINALSLLELSLYLPNMLLRDTDQMSMAHALEVREPLLDHVLVETTA